MASHQNGHLSKKKIFLIAVFSLILIFLAYCGYKVHALSAQQEAVKEDYSTVNNITFGILSASKWRDKIEDIVTHRIQTFHLTVDQQEELEKEIEQILNSLLNKAISIIEEPKKSLGSKIKKAAFNLFIDKDKLHQQVPVFARQILEDIQKPSSKKRLKGLAQSEIEELGGQTFDSSQWKQTYVTDSLFKKYHAQNSEDFDNNTRSLIHEINYLNYNYAFGMLGCILITLALWWFCRNKKELHSVLYMLCILAAIIVLVTGLTTTMIEVDARIKSLDFQLLGETVSFHNQVLFFQSKSIFDVVILLLHTGRVDSVFVGLLILCFSVFFPIAKLTATGIYLMTNRKWSKGKLVKFFAFKSSKWSMADVMVVAILMAYIGFNGIIYSQLKGLDIHTGTISSITTNHTSLQPGYIVFVGFVLYGLVLSVILKKITNPKDGLKVDRIKDTAFSSPRLN